MKMKMASPNPLVNVFYYHQLLAERRGEGRPNPLPDPRSLVREHSKLTVPANDPACSNSKSHPDLWLTNPVRSVAKAYKDVAFLTQLEMLCCAAQVRDCSNQDCRAMYTIMDNAAPPSSWRPFRHWALVVMSCLDRLAISLHQDLAGCANGSEGFAHVDKIVRAHTHLVNVVHACHLVLKTARETRSARMWRTRDGCAGPTQDLAGVCNIIYWMVNSQVFQNLGTELLSRWDHYYLPRNVSGLAIRGATRQIPALNLCNCRFWNLVDVAERKQSDLPDIVDRMNRDPRRTALRHVGHNRCAPTRCQFSHKNSTTVRQLHKCEFGDCSQSAFPVEDLTTALEVGEGTAWSTRERMLSAPDAPYVAISHVWADGTGVGVTTQGFVNSCLFEYFSRIAGRLHCEGIWWDALSIPLEPRARGKALGTMHKNYADAEYTVVHDQYLLNITCTDPETACVAIVLSPWFTRGWTALELRMATHVKVLFRSDDPQTPDIKDLDEDLLAKRPGPVSRLHWLASTIIRRLRTSTVEYVDDILGILKPRDTSWMRDRTIIASLLVGVPRCDYSRSEGEITRDIIMYLGYVPYSSLLHGRATMFEAGPFSWCPATLEEMPIVSSMDLTNRDERRARMLRVQDKGAVVGKWYCEPVTARQIEKNMIQPHGDHVSVDVRFYNALLDWENCVILRQHKGDLGPALLAVTVQTGEEHDKPLMDCRYVGAARIAPLDDHDNRDGKDEADDDGFSCEVMVRIGCEKGCQSDCRSRDAIEKWWELRKTLKNPFPDASQKKSQKSQDKKALEKSGQSGHSSDDEYSAATQQELLLEAFKSPNVADLLYLFVRQGVDISDDIKRKLSFEELSLLSSVYLATERRDEAQAICQCATAGLPATVAPGDISARNALCVLGKVCWKTGLLDDATRVYKHLIDSCNSDIVPEWRLQVQALGELSLVYSQRGQMSDASSCYQRAVGRLGNTPDKVYVFTYDAMTRLGRSYWERDAQDYEAETAYKDSLGTFEREIGNQHAITLITAQNLAGTCLGLGDISNAEGMLKDAICGLKKVAGINHELTLRAQFDLYRIYVLQGRLTKPERMVDFLGECKTHLHPGHWLTRLVLLAKGGLHLSTGQFEEAINPLKEAWRAHRSQDATEVYVAACASRELGMVHAMRGDLDEAATNFYMAQTTLHQHNLQEHLEAYMTLFCLATIKDARGDTDEAGDMFRDALKGMERICGPTDPETREAVTKLAHLCKDRVCEEDLRRDQDLEDEGASKEHVLYAIYRLRELLNRCGDLPGSKGRTVRAFPGYEAVFRTADSSEEFQVDREGSEFDLKLEKGEIVVRNEAVAISYVCDNTPFIVADDVVGTVVRVGMDETRFKQGDRVLGLAISSTTKESRHAGFREFTVVTSRLAARIPHTLSSAEAAVLPSGVATAAAALFQQELLGLALPSLNRRGKDNPRPLLVWDGATSPGCNAIQLAMAAGYEVITTALPKNSDYVRKLGASHVVNSNSTTVVDDLRKAFAGRGSVGAFDTIGSGGTRRACASVVGQAKVVVSSDVPALGLNEVSTFIFEKFLPRALAERKYIPAPNPIHTPMGPGALKFALETRKKVIVMVQNS